MACCLTARLLGGRNGRQRRSPPERREGTDSDDAAAVRIDLGKAPNTGPMQAGPLDRFPPQQVEACKPFVDPRPTDSHQPRSLKPESRKERDKKRRTKNKGKKLILKELRSARNCQGTVQVIDAQHQQQPCGRSRSPVDVPVLLRLASLRLGPPFDVVPLDSSLTLHWLLPTVGTDSGRCVDEFSVGNYALGVKERGKRGVLGGGCWFSLLCKQYRPNEGLVSNQPLSLSACLSAACHIRIPV